MSYHGGNAVTWLRGIGGRHGVKASGMKVGRGGAVDLHGGMVRKRFDGKSVCDTGKSNIVSRIKLLKPS
jgi:hypothetical protein